MFGRSAALAETDAAWCERIADDVESGVSYLPEMMAGDDGWGRWRVEVNDGASHIALA